MSRQDGYGSGCLVAIGLYVLALILSLESALSLLKQDGFDGLNNMFLLFLAMPWALLPVHGSDHVANAYMLFGFGLLNALLGLVLWWRSRNTDGDC